MGGVIRYHKSWNNIPKLCKSCHEREKAKWKEKKCLKCSTKISYNTDWEKIPDLCPSCIKKEKAKWKKKSCSSCGKVVVYNTDWENVPDLCIFCIERKKKGWRIVRCAKCTNNFNIHVSWDMPPKLCESCRKEKERQLRETFCKHCYQPFRYHESRDTVPKYCRKCYQGHLRESQCQKCSSTIHWLEFSVQDKKPNFCSNCFNQTEQEVLRASSYTDFHLERDIEYYKNFFRIDKDSGRQESVYEHVKREHHDWSGYSTDLDIFRAIFDLASGTGHPILQFTDNSSGNIIKFDTRSNLLAVFTKATACPLVTAYVVTRGLPAVVNKCISKLWSY